MRDDLILDWTELSRNLFLKPIRQEVELLSITGDVGGLENHLSDWDAGVSFHGFVAFLLLSRGSSDEEEDTALGRSFDQAP